MLKKSVIAVAPGLALAVAIAGIAAGFEWIEARLLGAVLLDGLVLAILLGTLVHTMLGLDGRLWPGIHFAAKPVLEVAIVLLGGTISAQALAASGLPLLASVAGVVVLALLVSYGIGRLLGLDARLAALVACGNSICGNSAIMATAPAMAAPSEDIAAAIGFTAVLGIAVVVLLPACFALLGLSEWQYGVLAGLTVYAVPQVLAATMPVSALSAQVGTLVKLVRVLMLGPVVLAIGLRHGAGGRARLPLSVLVPWFILGFLVLAGARASGLVPDGLAEPMRLGSNALTLVAMAGLGLSVNLRSVLASGGRVLAAGALSILALAALALLVARVLPAG